MRLVQFVTDGGVTPLSRLGVVTGDTVLDVTSVLPEVTSIAGGFQQARRAGKRLSDWLQMQLPGRNPASLSYDALLRSTRILPPVGGVPGEPVLVSGTGLTHLGSAQQRDSMHAGGENAPANSTPKTDSQKMFEMGLAGGRPAAGARGTPPEWFYKGDASILRGHGQPLEIPDFALDGGEEPEVAVIYIVDDQGRPCRLGFAQGNEWSDHVTEKINYLYLAPSKLRSCAIGPELVTDFAFDDVRVTCRVLRAGEEIYHSGELRSGEKNMCHTLANLEDHHFKFAAHRQPGQIHVQFLGTSKLSFPGRNWNYETGDLVEVSVEGLGPPLANPIVRQPISDKPIAVELG